MDTKKLRQKILDLAIHGKLVPQDPNDEPASVLLERIRTEKEKLIKEGKIKASKKSKSAGDTSHYPKDVPFEVPEGWATANVKDIFTINPKNHADDLTWAGFIPMASISDGFSDSFVYENRYWKDIKSGFTHFADGDVAVAKISPCLENRKSFIVRALPNGIGSGTTELFVFRSRYILPEYTLLFFKSNYFVSACVGTFNGVVGQQRAARSTIEGLAFPIPPVREQMRIVKEVKQLFDSIDEIENARSEIKAIIDKAKSNILKMAINGKLVPQDPSDEPAIELLKRINPDFVPSDNLHYEGCVPKGWQECRLYDLFNVTMGQSPNGNTLNKTDGVEFHQGKIYFTEKYLSESGIRTTSPMKYATSNSLLCCVRAPVGVFNITPRTICIGRGLCALIPRSEEINLNYWFYVLCSYKDYFDAKATGTTFKAISGEIVRNTIVLMPPMLEQNRILTRITTLFVILDQISNTINGSE